MCDWKKVKIGDFLTERTGRYKPDDKIISQYQRLDKIDFSGNIHISDKPSKTDMILVQPGDLVISGINVAKGAVAVYQGAEPVCATIHYSSYIFDDKKIDLEYFKYFVKSPAFIFALQQQVKGGIKTEIKPKHLLPLEISLPDLSTQKEIVKVLSKKIEKVELVKSEIESQKSYVKQLRQNILQEAIEGKLTEDWRKNNPVVKGNPDFDAEALFEKIQEEKRHTDSELPLETSLQIRNSKKKKVFEPISENEQPFEISEGWKWVRLGEIVENITSGSREWARYYSDTGAIFLRMGNLSRESYVLRLDNIQHVRVPESSEGKRTRLLPFDLLFSITAEIGNLGLIPKDFPEAYINQHTARIRFAQLVKQSLYFANALLAPGIKNLYLPNAHGMKNSFRLDTLSFIPIPLPPLAEQKEIVSRVAKLLANVTELEEQITEREEMTKRLMQSIMKDAFREE